MVKDKRIGYSYGQTRKQALSKAKKSFHFDDYVITNAKKTTNGKNFPFDKRVVHRYELKGHKRIKR